MSATAVDTRSAILDAAERAFAQEGLRGARTDRIAEEVGITKAMINYYFGSKAKLYDAVLERVYADREQSMSLATLKTLPPTEALRAYIERLLTQLARKPHIATLHVFENAQNSGMYFHQHGSIISILAGILERGMTSGDFRKTDVEYAAVHVQGVILHYFNIGRNARFLWTDGTLSDEDIVRGHIIRATEFIFAALRPEPKPHAPTKKR